MYAGWSCTLVSLSMYASGDSENRTVGLSTKQNLWVSQSRVKPGHFKSQNTQTGVKSFQFTECNVPHRSVTAWWNLPQYSTKWNTVVCACCFFLPEFVGDEDDASLQQQGGEHLEQAAHAQALQQAVKVHVLQPRVHRPTHGQHLRHNRIVGRRHFNEHSDKLFK